MHAKELVLLDDIETPEMKKRIESLVSGILRDLKNKAQDLTESSGVYPSMDEQNFKEYVQLVIKEVNRGK